MSSVFEIKFAQSNENKFDGEKDGENWQRKIRNYLCGRLPVMKPPLEWAEAFGKTEITQKDVEGLRCLLDEDPVVINHLLWAFFNVNLTGWAQEMYGNVSDFQGLEVWRRMAQKVNIWGDKRRDELAEALSNPKGAHKPEELAKALEAWDTNIANSWPVVAVPFWSTSA